MKKFSFLLSLFLLPAIALGGSLQKQIANAFDWSHTIQSETDSLWAVYNSSNNVKTVFVTGIDIASDTGGYFVFRSTEAGRGYVTSATTAGTATPASLGSTAVAKSSVTHSELAAIISDSEGVIRWSGIVKASETYKVIGGNNIWAINPGFVLYAIHDTGAVAENGKTSISFRLIERPR